MFDTEARMSSIFIVIRSLVTFLSQYLSFAVCVVLVVEVLRLETLGSGGKMWIVVVD